MSGRRRITAVAAVALAAIAAPAPAGADWQWTKGRSASSTVVNCPSIIFGTWTTEKGAQADPFVWADPAAPPQVGDVFEIAVLVSALGNPCTDPYTQQAAYQVDMPAGLERAGEHAMECYRYDLAAGTATRLTSGCPTSTRPGLDGTLFPYGNAIQQPPGFFSTSGWFPLAQGVGVELQIPVRATAPLDQELEFPIRMYDANDNPVLRPRVPIRVVAPPVDLPADPGTPAVPGTPAGPGTPAAPGPVADSTPRAGTMPATGTVPVGAVVAPVDDGVENLSIVPRSLRMKAALRGLRVRLQAPHARVEMRLVWTARLGRRTVTLARATKRLALAGRAEVRLTPSKAAATLLRRARRATTRLTVTSRTTGAGAHVDSEVERVVLTR